jgi:hypothetical protein
MDYKNQNSNTPSIPLVIAKSSIKKPVTPNAENQNKVFRSMIVPLPAAVKHINRRYSFDNNGGNYQGL